jgi:hypothetical protein
MSAPGWLSARPALATPFFGAVRPLLAQIEGDSWPSLATLNALATKEQLVNVRGQPIRFVAPVNNAGSAMQYEQRIAANGEIATRENWHDLFNALQWLAMPKAKAAISEQHARLLAQGGENEARVRSVARDVLTLFDENGVIVASSDPSMLQLIRDFKWTTLFVDRRHEVMANMRFYLVGHGMLEKSLTPFIGLTAKALLMPVDGALLQMESPALLTQLDQHAAAWLMNENNLTSTRHLCPLPLLGIPGWDARNEFPAFYGNAGYFRDGYLRDRRPNTPA